ncbi:AI-2E family transporter [Candidatus Peregrinibacteria bacterium]|nr:AI-2E family transporter [Candidatus Peregrinibacteria bacterium]
MNPPSKSPSPGDAFTSIRVIGKKAQRFLSQAKRTLRQPETGRSERLPRREKKIDEVFMHISAASVAKATFAVLAILVGSWAVYHLRDKIILLLLAFFLAAVVDPSVTALERMRMPRSMAVLLHYFLVIFILLFLLFSFIPIIADQIQGIAVIISTEVDTFLGDPHIALPFVDQEVNIRLTTFLQATLQNLSINQFADALGQFGQNLSIAAQGSVRFATRIAGSLLNVVLSLIIVLVLAFFIQMEKEGISRWFRSFLPLHFRTYVDNKSEAVHTKIAQWARGELLLMLTIFSLTLVALLILRMPYALTLAVLAGLCEFLPAVGPFIAAVPSVLIAFTQEGPVMGLVVMGVYYVIQWCENNFIVPLVMKRTVGLSPIAILFAMLVGVSFTDTIHPVLGVMLAVPATTILTIFLEDWRNRHG